MRTNERISHITDDLGNDVVTPVQLDEEFTALCAVAEAVSQDHRAHCHLLTDNCPLCRALAELDLVRQGQSKFRRQ